MSDQLPTTWPAEPHTFAKHKILEGYLKAWMQILATVTKGILFIDGFAGPGEYAGGQQGSPIIALKAALANASRFKSKVHFLFVENRQDRLEHLNGVLARYDEEVAKTSKINILPPCCGDCTDELRKLLAESRARKKRHGPWLAFLDQFGYSQVPMSLISEIMSGDMCEVLTYLEVRKLVQFITDETKWPGIDAAFGGDQWKPALTMRGEKRERFIAETYARALREKAGANYVWYFAMKGANNALLYWLFFCTKSVRGLEEMKKSMLKVDESGGFVFSDAANPDQLSLVSGLSAGWLPRDLERRFRDQIATLGEIRHYVLVDTPLVNFKRVLAELERNGRIQVVDASKARRRGSFADDSMRIQFASNPLRPRQGELLKDQ